MEKGLTKNQVIRELMRSSHSKLDQYTPIVREAARYEPEFLAHLIAWNHKNGQIRDSQVALPVVSMYHLRKQHGELFENSLAHIASLDPRSFVQGLHFAKSIAVPGQRRLGQLATEYIKYREERYPLWERAVLQHRESMLTIYCRWHVKPSGMAQKLLFDKQYVKGTALWTMANLRGMSDMEAAGAILHHKLPFLPVSKILGKRIRSDSLGMALIQAMSPSELAVNMKMLERFGVRDKPVLRAALDERLEELKRSKKNVLKASKAAEAVKDETLKKKLHAAQEKQLENVKIDGDWVVLGDRSSSMQSAIEAAKEIAAFLASVVKGKVYLVFFNSTPRMVEVTGKTYAQVQEMCKYVTASGMTSIGCGLNYLQSHGLSVDGIALVSDGAENSPPFFVSQYEAMMKRKDADIPVYYYRVDGQDDVIVQQMKRAGHEVNVFDLRSVDVDYYSLPNLAATMTTKRYGLLDAVMDTPLLTMKEVFH